MKYELGVFRYHGRPVILISQKYSIKYNYNIYNNNQYIIFQNINFDYYKFVLFIQITTF